MRHAQSLIKKTGLAIVATVVGLSDLAAADLAVLKTPISEQYQLECSGFEPNWPSVWLGHFSGGRVSTGYGQADLDWVDKHYCFPSKRNCDAWVGSLRRRFHRPEGFWTCLPLR